MELNVTLCVRSAQSLVVQVSRPEKSPVSIQEG